MPATATPEFTFKDQKVRVVVIEGNPWFVAPDERHKVGGNNLPVALKNAGINHVTLISESGLYKLVMRSDKPEAKAFQDWVTREVLPSIRKTAGLLLDRFRGFLAEGAPFWPVPFPPQSS